MTGDEIAMTPDTEAFPSTNWLHIEELKDADSSIYQDLINHLALRYWRPVYWFLRKKGFPCHAAKDLTQDFFCEIVLQKKIFQKADKRKGRLRTFLLSCLTHFTANYHRKEASQKNRPVQPLVPLDALTESSNLLKSSELSPEQTYHIAWVQQLLQETLEQVKSYCCRNGQSVHWDVFYAHFLQPIMEQSPRPCLKAVCACYGLRDEKQAANMLITVKRTFRRSFCEKLAVSSNTPSDIEEELHDIFKLFE